MDDDTARFTAFGGDTFSFEWARNYGQGHPRHVSWDQVRSWASSKQHTTTAPAAARHLYTPITDAYEIRVLEIKPGTGSENLLGSLHHCSIEFESELDVGDKPYHGTYRTAHALSMEDLTRPLWYTALSYTWGPPSFDKIIKCNGHDKRITKSLHSALSTFRQPNHSIFVWVDQICIDQNDDDEKAGQINLMSRIYEHALNTVIWLGESSATSPLGLWLLHDLASRLQFNTSCSGPADFQGLAMPPPDSPSWVGLWDVLSRPWFKRVWIIQELSASRDAWVFCGSEHISWERLESTCNHFKGQGINSWLRRQFGGDDFDDENDVSGVAVDLSQIRLSYLTQPKGSDVFSLLVESRSALCSDSRDKVYGVLSLCKKAEAANIYVSYKPDYPAETLYCNVVANILAKTPSKLSMILTCVDHEWPAAGLPSWVADWRRPRQTASLGYSTATSSIYSAAGKSYPVFSINATELEVHGITCDTLDKFTNIFDKPDLARKDPATENKVLKSCAALVSTLKHYPAKGGVFEALWRSLVGNKNDTGQLKAPASFAEIFSLLLDESTGSMPTLSDQTYSERQQRPKHKGRLELASLATRNPGRIFEEARTAMMLAAKNRRLGITRNGYIGLFHRGCQKGDIICILRGCHVPFLIRQEVGDDKFHLVGECYVHGIMEGEAVKTNVKWKLMKIV